PGCWSRGSSPSSRASATPTRTARTSSRWTSGTPPTRTAASAPAGWGGPCRCCPTGAAACRASTSAPTGCPLRRAAARARRAPPPPPPAPPALPRAPAGPPPRRQARRRLLDAQARAGLPAGEGLVRQVRDLARDLGVAVPEDATDNEDLLQFVRRRQVQTY